MQFHLMPLFLAKWLPFHSKQVFCLTIIQDFKTLNLYHPTLSVFQVYTAATVLAAKAILLATNYFMPV